MNKLDEAIEIIEKGWCTSKLHKVENGEDKFCAVGALGSVLLEKINLDVKDSVYIAVGESLEGKVLADVILEEQPRLKIYYKPSEVPLRVAVSQVIYKFNDRSLDKYSVVDMLKLASKRFDELYPEK